MLQKKVIVCFVLCLQLMPCWNDISPENVMPSDPTELDPVWEATIRNVVYNTTMFKPTSYRIIIEKDKNEEDDNEGDSVEDELDEEKVTVKPEQPIKTDNDVAAASQVETQDDETRIQREKALRSWLEMSLLDISKNSRIPKSQQNRPLTRWSRLSELFSREIESLARAVTPTITESLYTANVSSSCSRDFLRLVFGIQNNQDWAWRILDASGRLPSGLISGSSFAFGDYDQCLEYDSSKTEEMLSRYCLLHFSIPVPELKTRGHYKESPKALYDLLENNQESGFNPSMRRYMKRLYQAMYSTTIINGLCVPATCSAEDVKNFILSFDTFKNQSTIFAAEIRVSHCTAVRPETDDNTKKSEISLQDRFQTIFDSFSVNEKLAFLALMILFVIPVLSWTINRFIPFMPNNDYSRFLENFSLIQNLRSLLRITHHHRQSRTQFLNILRILSTFWIILTHCAILGSFFAPSIVYRFEAEARVFAFSAVGQLFYNAYVSVEIFFFLSGFLLLRTITKNPKNFPTFFNYVILRYLRLIPSVIGLLSIFTFWKYFGSGPIFDRYSSILLDSCGKNWWKTLLFVNNYDKSDDICLVHTWFLSADFQLHIIAYPILLAISKRSFNFARFIIILLVAFSLLWSITKLNSRRAPASLNALLEIVPDEFYNDMQALYYPTQNHLISYLVGLCTAYYYQTKQNILPKSRNSNVLLIIPAIAFASIFFPVYWTRDNGPMDVQTNIGMIYFIFSRSIHPISIACLCLWALPKTVKLYNSFVVIFSRLTFSIYLIHLPIIWHFLFTARQQIRLEFISVLFFFGGILLFTIPLSVIFYLLIEIPYTNVFNQIIMKSESNPSRTNISINEDNNNNNNKIFISQHDRLPFETSVVYLRMSPAFSLTVILNNDSTWE